MYIYADNAATTKISKSALDAMIKTNEEQSTTKLKKAL